MSDLNSDHENDLSTQSTYLKAERKPALFGWKIALVAIIGIVGVLYTTIDFSGPDMSGSVEENLAPIFDSRLASCKAVVNARPSEKFDDCLSAATDGNNVAIKRMVWAYSRKGEYQDLSKVFEWLRAVRNRDNATELLMYSLVHLNAEAGDLRKESEVGISRLVAKNYAPANVVLASIYALEENVLPPTSNILWLLNKAIKKDIVALEPTTLAVIHANGFISPENINAGASLLKEFAEHEYPVATNNIAWFLATLDTNPFSTSDYALSLAQRVVDDPLHAKNPIYIDTLAATLAANKRFEEAVEAQELAITLTKESDLNASYLARTLIEYEERLNLYSQENTLVELKLRVDKATFFKQMRNRTLEYVLSNFFEAIDVPLSPKSDVYSVENEAKTSTE
jgi:hypothetical protein